MVNSWISQKQKYQSNMYYARTNGEGAQTSSEERIKAWRQDRKVEPQVQEADGNTEGRKKDSFWRHAIRVFFAGCFKRTKKAV
tara:strand:+ start:1209 stop:1457 length:249 start_codon:yes stop_codon:yes gene_type:complete